MVKDNSIIGPEIGISVESGTGSDVIEHNLIKNTETGLETGTSADGA